jgi:WD40 repeat protein
MKALAPIDSYGIRHLPAHLLAGKKWESLTSLFQHMGFVQAKASQVSLYALLEDMLAALRFMPEGLSSLQTQQIYHLLDTYSHQSQAIPFDLLPNFFLQELYNLALSRGEIKIVDSVLKVLKEQGGIWVNNKNWRPIFSTPGRILSGHPQVLMAVAFSPDGKLVATGCHDGKIRLFNASTGQQDGELVGHTANVEDILFLPNLDLASAGWDHTVRLWDTKCFTEIQRWEEHTDIVRCIDCSSDGHYIASGSGDHTIRIWSPGINKSIAILKAHTDSVHSVAFSPDGKRLASAGYDKEILKWDVQQFKLITRLTGHTGYIWQVAFDPVGQRLVSTSHDKTIRIWDWETGVERNRIEGFQSMMASVRFSPDGEWLAAAGSDWDGNQVIVWDAINFHEIGYLNGHTLNLWKLAFSPDSKWLATASSDWTARVWSLRDLQKANVESEQHDRRVRSVEVAQNGGTLLSLAVENVAWLWDARKGSVRWRLPTDQGGYIAIALSQNGKIALTATAKGVIQAWDTQKCIELFHKESQNDNLTGLSISPDGIWIGATGAGKTTIWNFFNHEKVTNLANCADGKIAFGPEQDFVALAGTNGAIQVWKWQSGMLLYQIEASESNLNSLAISPDGKWLASGSDDKNVYLVGLATGNLRILSGHTRMVRAVAFSVDGQILASGSWDQTVRFWDVQTGRLLAASYTQNAVAAMQGDKKPDTFHVVDIARCPGSYTMKLMSL